MLAGLVGVAVAGMLRLSSAPPAHWTGLQWLWVPLAVTVPIALVFGALELRIDARSLQWRFGWLGWPRWRLDLDDIDRIEPTRVRSVGARARLVV